MPVRFDLKLIVSIIALIISIIPKTPKLSGTFSFRLSKFTQSIIGYLNSFGTLTALVAVFFLVLNTISLEIKNSTFSQIYYNITYRISFSIIFMIILIIFISALSMLIEVKIHAVRKRVILRNISKYLEENV